MDAYTIKGLSVETNLPSGVISRLTRELKDMHLLIFEAADQDSTLRFTPAEDINHLTINLLLERIDNYGEKITPAAINRNNKEWESLLAIRARYICNEEPVLLKDI